MGIDGVVVVAQYGNEKERSEEESLGVVVFIRDYFVVIVGSMEHHFWNLRVHLTLQGPRYTQRTNGM